MKGFRNYHKQKKQKNSIHFTLWLRG